MDWLPPDFGAVGQYAVIFAREIAETGRRVCLVGLTSGECNKRMEASAGRRMSEVKLIRAKPYRKTVLLSRLTWSFMTNLRLIWEVVGDPRSRGAEILFTGSPPFMLFFALPAKWLRRARLIYRITDFYPETLSAALGKRLFPLTLIEAITWRLRKHVDMFQVLGEDQRKLLLAGGIRPERISLKRDVPPISISGHEKPMQRPDPLIGHRISLYSGNYGVAHDVDTVIEGPIRHHRKGSAEFGLWLNASGSKLETVENRLQDGESPVCPY